MLGCHRTCYERLDGSGYFRSLGADSLGPPQRLLAAATVHVALRTNRRRHGRCSKRR